MSLRRNRRARQGPLPQKLEAVMVRLCRSSPYPLNITQAVKLPYLVDVLAARVLGSPITEGSHEAWERGVVTSEAWHGLHSPNPPNFYLEAVPYSEEQKVRVSEAASDEALSDDEKRIVDYILDEYGELSASDLGLMTKLMNPAVPKWGHTSHRAKVNEDAYLRMTPEYQEMASAVSRISFDEVVRTSHPIEDLDLEDALA